MSDKFAHSKVTPWWPPSKAEEDLAARFIKGKAYYYIAVWAVGIFLSRRRHEGSAAALSLMTFLGCEGMNIYVMKRAQIRMQQLLLVLEEKVTIVLQSLEKEALIDILDPARLFEINELATRQDCHPLFRQADAMSGDPQLRADLQGWLKMGEKSDLEKLLPHFEVFKTTLQEEKGLRSDLMARRQRSFWLIWGAASGCWKLAQLFGRSGNLPLPAPIKPLLLPQIA